MSASKAILLVHMECLFPRVTGNQERVYRMAERLSRDHVVDVATTVLNDGELAASREGLRGVCRAFHPIAPINPTRRPLARKLRRLQFLAVRRLLHHPHQYFYGGHPAVTAQLGDLVRQKRYDVVQVAYWYMARLFEGIGGGAFKAVDTLDVLSDKRRQEIEREHGGRVPARRRRELDRYRDLEIRCLRLADLVIAISGADQRAFADLALGNDTLLVPIGQDLAHFAPAGPAARVDDVVLFYGNMGSLSNRHAFVRLWRDIFPGIRQAVPGARLLVVGANPPESIRRLHDGRNVIVTGYVDDVRPQLARAKVAVIPLEVAGGFRGRAVEMMAMEIPVIGTPRALDCVELTTGVDGIVTDSDAEMAAAAAALLTDDARRRAMGAAARALVTARYSLDATVGVLSEYYRAL